MSKNRTSSKHADRAYSSSRDTIWSSSSISPVCQRMIAQPLAEPETAEGLQRVESSQYATRYLAATALDGATGKGGGGVSPSRRVRRSSGGPQIAQSRELKFRGQIAHKSLNLLAKRPIFGVKPS